MHVGVDIGGTKTLVAVLDANGVIVESDKFPTPKVYDEFLKALEQTVEQFTNQDYLSAGIAVPGRLDRHAGTVISLGNLPWHNEPIQADCEAILNCPVVVENDAKMAGLSESMLNLDASTILYVTVSTGIGTSVIHDQKLDPSMLNSEGGQMMIPFKGKLTTWESFASGRAIAEKFGKKAADIDPSDTETWRYIAHNLSVGIFELITVVEPGLIIVGGSIGTYFNNYGELLIAELKKFETPMVPIPRIIQAKRPEEAAVFGCYDLAKQVFPYAINK